METFHATGRFRHALNLHPSAIRPMSLYMEHALIAYKFHWPRCPRHTYCVPGNWQPTAEGGWLCSPCASPNHNNCPHHAIIITIYNIDIKQLRPTNQPICCEVHKSDYPALGYLFWQGCTAWRQWQPLLQNERSLGICCTTRNIKTSKMPRLQGVHMHHGQELSLPYTRMRMVCCTTGTTGCPGAWPWHWNAVDRWGPGRWGTPCPCSAQSSTVEWSCAHTHTDGLCGCSDGDQRHTCVAHKNVS